MNRTDSDLIVDCLSGNETAWKELVDRYARLVYSIALSNGLRKDEAEDVFQEVFTLVFRYLKDLRNHKVIAAWLITITSRECQRLRRQIPRTVELDEEIPDPSDSLEDELQVWERRHVVRLAMKQLEASCRQLLEMLFAESPMSYASIANRLGIPVGSIGPTRARCFKKLETILKTMGADLGS